jgi:hypothetical protein
MMARSKGTVLRPLTTALNMSGSICRDSRAEKVTYAGRMAASMQDSSLTGSFTVKDLPSGQMERATRENGRTL